MAGNRETSNEVTAFCFNFLNIFILCSDLLDLTSAIVSLFLQAAFSIQFMIAKLPPQRLQSAIPTLFRLTVTLGFRQFGLGL